MRIIILSILLFIISISNGQVSQRCPICPPSQGSAPNGSCLQVNNGVAEWASCGGGGGFWSLTGNAGTDPNTNFIGTTDGADLIFKRNNTFSGRIASKDLILGYNSTTTSGLNTTAIGTRALQNLTNGTHNTSIGSVSGLNVTDGSENSFLGQGAGSSIVSGSYNTFIGYNANGNGDVSNAISLGNNALANSNQLYISDSINEIHAVLGGTYGAGKVLTSDANGNATWQMQSSARVVSSNNDTARSEDNGGTMLINNGAGNWTFYLPAPSSVRNGYTITVARINSLAIGTITVSTLAGVVQDLAGTFSGTFSIPAFGVLGRSMTWVSDGTAIWYLKCGNY